MKGNCNLYMKEKKVWCVLFNTLNVHLIKEIGMIPWTMYKKYGFEGVVATYNNEEYSYLEKEVKGIRTEYVKKITGNFKIDSVLWLFRNAKKCDVLQLFHIRKLTMIHIALFHALNKRGKIYLKLDGGGVNVIPKKEQWKRLFFKMIQYVNTVSIELQRDTIELQRAFGDKVICIPNGFYDDGSLCDCRKKQNIICTCGRLGTEQKNTELLLNAFTKSYHNLQNWRLILIGPYTDEFYDYYQKWRLVNPGIAEKVFLTGNITERKKINEYYDMAKIFCLTSRWEGFSLALIEAASRGDYLLSCNVGGASEVIGVLHEGELFESGNEKELVEKMIKACKMLEETKAGLHMEIAEKIKEKYAWEVSCQKLYEHLFQ